MKNFHTQGWYSYQIRCRILHGVYIYIYGGKQSLYNIKPILRVHLIHTSERPLNPLIQLKFHLIHISVGLDGAPNNPAMDQECFTGSERSACLFRFSSNLNDLFYLPLLGNPNPKVKTFYQLVKIIETKT